ncbi:MAG: hypothetical protein ACJASX_002327 [Limisphaerales bacterium]|jgi:hypothetical protein
MNCFIYTLTLVVLALPVGADSVKSSSGAKFFEIRIRPLLVEHCYDCHSEESKERKGGLLLDRESGWLKGGDTENAIVPGEPDASLLIKAIRHSNKDLQMPPKYRLDPSVIAEFERWVKLGAPGPKDDMGQTKFSRLGDQKYLFAQAANHWAFQPVKAEKPPQVSDPVWNRNPIDQFVYAGLAEANLKPSRAADARTLIRRLSFDLSGLPPTPEGVAAFVAAAAAANRGPAIKGAIDQLLAAGNFGEHLGRMWLDVARYADTDSTYRADTKTPHYFPFAFTYRNYVIEAFNADKPYPQFIREQLAADRLGMDKNAPELAALGFLSVGPHRRNTDNSIDDWIDVTTRGLLGISVACARCHDHKFEPVPTTDYYSLHGVFASISRSDPLNEKAMPEMPNVSSDAKTTADYERRRTAIDKKVEAAGNTKSRNNRRSVAAKIRETELAELLLFHEGAPARAMVVKETRKPVTPFVYVRGNRGERGASIPRRFLKILDPKGTPFAVKYSGRLDLVNHIVANDNPLTARVFVNRIWGFLMGSYLVATPSDFGLQGTAPTHPRLLDWLANDFVENGWSLKHLVRQIVTSRCYQQRSGHRSEAAELDPENRLLWRANRSHLNVEALRDSLLATSGQLDPTPLGRAGHLWGKDYTRKRSIYGFVNRFNLDPTLRAFDFPSAMQSASQRGESIVAPQALFTMNSPFVIDQSRAIAQTTEFKDCKTDVERVNHLFARIVQRAPTDIERERSVRFVSQQSRFYNEQTPRLDSPWPLMAQALYMSNEFQYVD